MTERQSLKNKNVLWLDNVARLSSLQRWKAKRATRSLQEITNSLVVFSVLPRIRKKIGSCFNKVGYIVWLLYKTA